MIFSSLQSLLPQLSCINLESRNAQNAALVLDIITGIVLLTLGILAATNVISFSCMTTGGILGAGVVYVAAVVLRLDRSTLRFCFN